jgi:hypothetical protein
MSNPARFGEDCRLSSDAGIIDGCAGINIGSAVEEQSGCRNIVVFPRGGVSMLKDSKTKATCSSALPCGAQNGL